MSNTPGDTPQVPEPTRPIDVNETSVLANQGTASDPTAGAPAPVSSDPSASTVTLTDEKNRGGGSRKGLLIGGLVGLLAVGGGSAVAVNMLSGSGAQPADVMPADTYLYGRVDVDPSAGQKVAAVRFLSKLPEVKKAVETDWRKSMWDKIVAEDKDGCVSKLSFDNDIAPWLGDRMGVGLRPGSTKDTPNIVLALQVKDESKAKEGLGKLAACGTDAKDSSEVNYRDGYALLTPKGKGAETLAALDKGTLATDATFTADMAALGEQGIASGWVNAQPAIADLVKLAGTSGDVSQEALAQVKSHGAAALRFDASYIELAGIVRGADQLPAAPAGTSALAGLPGDTIAAANISGLDQSITKIWPQLAKAVESAANAEGQDNPIPVLEQELGMKADEALSTLLGKNLTIAVPDQAFGKDNPAFGLRIETTDGPKAQEVITKIEDMTGERLPFPVTVDGNTLYLTSSADYTAKLKAGGTLGNEASFKTAMGDANGLVSGLFVNLDKIENQYLVNIEDADEKAFVEALSSVGVSGRITGAGEGSFSVRLVGN